MTVQHFARAAAEIADPTLRRDNRDGASSK
jgi:hypothetical protein